MKKILLALLLCFSLCACSSQSQEGFVSIDVQNVLTKISNKDTFLVIINNEGCYSCDTFKEELQETVDKNGLTIYTLNYDSITEVDIDQLNIALGKYTSWPVAFYVVEGEIPKINKYEYSTDPEGWQKWLEDMKIIND